MGERTQAVNDKSSIRKKVMPLVLGATLVGSMFSTSIDNAVSAAEKGAEEAGIVINADLGNDGIALVADTGYIEGEIVVRYQDEDGRDIAPRVKQSSQVGQPFEVTAKDITGYKVKDDSTVKGEYDIGSNVVVFVYEKVSDDTAVFGKIIASYVDEDGNEIGLRTTDVGEIGETFDIEPKDIPGYSYVEVEGDATGEYTEGITNITFKYEKDVEADTPVVGGVVVKYVDTKGNEIIERDYQQGNIQTDKHDAEQYKTVFKQVDGYGLVNIKGNTEGDFVKGITIVEYVYEAIKDDPGFEDFSNVIVKYVDKSGNEIGVRDRIYDKIGNEYNTNAKSINGFTFSHVIGDATGKVGDKTTVIEYVYDKDDEDKAVVEGEIVIKHVDITGKEIADRDVITGEIGAEYSTDVKALDGYELSKVNGEVTGEIGEGVTTIEYVYEKIVDEPEVDTDGEDVDEPEVDTDGEDVDEPEVDTDGEDVDEPEVDTDGEDVDEPEVDTDGEDVDEPEVDTDGEDVDEPEVDTDGEDDEPNIDTDLEDENNNNTPQDPDVETGGDEDEPNIDTELEDENNANTPQEPDVDGNEDDEPNIDTGLEDDNNDNTPQEPDVDTDGNGVVDEPNIDTGLEDDNNDNTPVVPDTDDNGNSGEPNIDTGLEDDNNNNSTQAPDANNGSGGSNGQSPNTSNGTNDGNGQVTNAEEVQEGKRLANTATDTFSLMAIGSTLAALAGSLLFFNRRKKTDSDEVVTEGSSDNE